MENDDEVTGYPETGLRERQPTPETPITYPEPRQLFASPSPQPSCSRARPDFFAHPPSALQPYLEKEAKERARIEREAHITFRKNPFLIDPTATP